MDAISCLPPATYLLTTSAAAYTDIDIARTINFSSSDPCSSSSLFAHLGAGGGNWFASAPAPPMAESVLVASTPTPTANKRQQQQLGPRAGGAGKPQQRRAKRRPSKRAPTTYISTDPANFRFMVQHVTGAGADGFLSPASASAMLLQQDAVPYGGAVFGQDDALLVPADDDAGIAALQRQHHRQQQEQQRQQACFPTLDSWSVMYHDQI